ncbi:hypothetical protein STEG23_011749 [Scotinomys teguina]
MEVVAAAPRCQLLLIVLMLLPWMKGSLLLVRRKIARTIELQENIGKEELRRKALRTVASCTAANGLTSYWSNVMNEILLPVCCAIFPTDAGAFVMLSVRDPQQSPVKVNIMLGLPEL